MKGKCVAVFNKVTKILESFNNIAVKEFQTFFQQWKKTVVTTGLIQNKSAFEEDSE